MLAIFHLAWMIERNPPMDIAFVIPFTALMLICVVFPLLGVVVFWFRARGSFLEKAGWSLLIIQPFVGLFFLNEALAKCGLSLRSRGDDGKTKPRQPENDTPRVESEARHTLRQFFPEIELGALLGGSSGGRLVFRASYKENDVIAKLHPQADKAEHEKNALAAAKGLLGSVGLRVPSVLGKVDRGILIESIDGQAPDIAGNDHHLRLCIEYLAGMARVEIPSGMVNHYHGAHLRHRLEQERGFLESAASRFPEVSDLRRDFESIFAVAVAAVDSDPKGVVAHGDFQPQNLIITASRELVPVDWSDFGLAHHGYEIANLLFDLDSDRMRLAFSWYGDSLEWQVSADCLTQGLAIACIIRAGANLRQLLSGVHPSQDSIAKARQTLLQNRGLLTRGFEADCRHSTPSSGAPELSALGSVALDSARRGPLAPGHQSTPPTAGH